MGAAPHVMPAKAGIHDLPSCASNIVDAVTGLHAGVGTSDEPIFRADGVAARRGRFVGHLPTAHTPLHGTQPATDTAARPQHGRTAESAVAPLCDRGHRTICSKSYGNRVASLPRCSGMLPSRILEPEFRRFAIGWMVHSLAKGKLVNSCITRILWPRSFT
jgi:hypothetical protein